MKVVHNYLSEPRVVRKSFSPRWATTATTTMEPELPDNSVASEVFPVRVFQDMVAVIVVAGPSRAFAQQSGPVLFFEGAPEQVSFTDFIGGSHVIPRFLMSPAWHQFGHVQRRLAPASTVFEDDVLNWDAAIELAPSRPGGTLTVTLHYAGRGKPRPVEDPWA
jgi:hypothetical protein